jgi:hypothetical protein
MHESKYLPSDLGQTCEVGNAMYNFDLASTPPNKSEYLGV